MSGGGGILGPVGAIFPQGWGGGGSGAAQQADAYAAIAADSRNRMSSADYRDKAAHHEDSMRRASRRLSRTLSAVDDLFGPAASEVLRRLYDDLHENAGEAIDNLQHHAGLLRAELEDRRIRETGELRVRAADLAVENARLRQAGRVLALELAEAQRLDGHRRRQRRAAVSAWSKEDPQ